MLPKFGEDSKIADVKTKHLLNTSIDFKHERFEINKFEGKQN